MSEQIAEYRDPVTEFYKQKVDLAAIRENLKLTPAQRLRKFFDETKRADLEARQNDACRDY